MGNCLARQSDSPNSHRNSNNGSNNNHLGSSQLPIRRSTSRLLQSTSNSTLLGRSSTSAGNSRLFGPSSSKTYTTSNTNTSLLGSDISQALELRGEGGFGRVYKGLFKGRAPSRATRGGRWVAAIKRLNPDGFQGFAEWQSEVNFLGRLSHPNLVKLLGFGRENGELFLVYEFMHKGTLANHLFGRGSNVRPLPWDTRLKIIIGAARGLDFLHSLENRIIYRDFKPSNILLDENYIAKLSDFGLAKEFPSGDRTHVTTRIIGTQGYAAPEYVATGHLSMKSDVYGFGIVLVEILTGKSINDLRKHGPSLIDWLKSNLLSRGKMINAMDSRLEGRYPPRLALQVAQLALKCVQTEHKVRPSMMEVVETLKKVEAAQLHGRPDGG
ncbi:probable serine/threonine-protein kinase PIX13 isoform X2 [Neltuma alba]|uniref:probable serine/threonine-protein kinase PIX13 isoform X2 n=1 Tax=Neltuma alba TaxID=207710 RepID=UPI0010A50291|nr:probable serine/threonine-protein kinase PIX13 isoform X2 [Prosopis alba]